ncbi:MAG: multiprotein-bridging factor 1 family protein [Anaerotignum sp.]
MGIRLGEKIKERRIALGWSVPDLARKVGINPNSVRDWERGKITPSERFRRVLLDVIGVDYYDESIIEGNLYLVVSNDEYALPVFVAQSLDELSEMTGKSKKHILQMISKGKHEKNPMYIVVDVDEND